MIRFPCPACWTTLHTDDALVGKSMRCPKCTTLVDVPLSVAPPTANSEAATPEAEPEVFQMAPLPAPPMRSAPTPPPVRPRPAPVPPPQAPAVIPEAPVPRPAVKPKPVAKPEEPREAEEIRPRRSFAGFFVLFLCLVVCGSTIGGIVYALKLKETTDAKRPARVEPESKEVAVPKADSPTSTVSRPGEVRDEGIDRIPMPHKFVLPADLKGKQTPKESGKRETVADAKTRKPKEEEYEAQPKRLAPLPADIPDPDPEPKLVPTLTVPQEIETRETDPAVLRLTQELRSTKSAERLKAAEGLAEIGPKGKSSSRAICEALLDANSKVRFAAAEALEKVNPILHKLVIPLLVDKDIGLRTQCLHKIGELGAEGAAAVPVVIWFKQQNLGGATAIAVLVTIGAHDSTVSKKLAGWLLRDADASVRVASASGLPLVEGGKEQIKVLAHSLQTDPADEVRAACAAALGEFGPAARSAVKSLRVAKTDSAGQVREAAQKALEKIP